MTLPIHKQNLDDWSCDRLKLTHNQKKELLDLLGYDYETEKCFRDRMFQIDEKERTTSEQEYNKNNSYIKNIETILSSYEGMVLNLDYKPNDSDFRTQLSEINKKIEALQKTLSNTHNKIIESLENDCIDISDFKKDLEYIQKKSEKIISHKTKKSNGAKRKDGLRLLINLLIYDYEHRCHPDFREISKSYKYPEEYMKTCLAILNIKYPKNLSPYVMSEKERRNLFTVQKKGKK